MSILDTENQALSLYSSQSCRQKKDRIETKLRVQETIYLRPEQRKRLCIVFVFGFEWNGMERNGTHFAQTFNACKCYG